ncbi:MAG TPA: hypothetical protein ENN20_07745 [Candidatus Marinimicrobia bacterium]|nr:hypothetical protein [Candidatus Neomarinimicrobiota bacterium]
MRITVTLFFCFALIACGGGRKLVDQVTDEPAARPSDSSVGVLKTPITFLPSYRDAGGPHLKIDSLNRVIALDAALVQEIWSYYEQKKDNDSTVSRGKMTVRYYASRLSPNDLLMNEMSPEKAREQPHFKAVFDTHNNLTALEYIGEQALATPSAANLKALYASYWNIITNRRINYVDENGNRPAPRIKFFSDAAKLVHRIEYLNRNREVVAVGNYIYGIKNLILEQRIVFPEGGFLTDLHPDLFYRQYDRVESDWVVKCLYGSGNQLIELIVMQDSGLIFFRYRFQHEIYGGQRIVETHVYDSNNIPVGRYELYFDGVGELVKKIIISDDRQISSYSTYGVDLEKLEMVINNFDQNGNPISRIYREL